MSAGPAPFSANATFEFESRGLYGGNPARGRP